MGPRKPLPRHLADSSFTYADGIASGLGEGRLRGADLGRPFHGVRSASKDLPSVRARCQAFATRIPPDGFFNSITAAVLMDVPLPARFRDAPIHVAVVNPHRGIQSKGVVGHKVILMGEDRWDWLGMPVATPERCWCELGRLLSVPELVAAGDRLVHWRAPLTTQERIVGTLARFPDRRGRSRLLLASTMLDERAESPKESELRVVLELGGIRNLVANHPVRIGTRWYRLDLALVKYKIGIEYQGDYHRDPDQWRRDMSRISQLESDGWFIIQVNANDLRDPTELTERILRVIAARLSE